MSSEKVGSPGLTYNHKLLYLYTLFMFIELLLFVVTYFKMKDGVKELSSLILRQSYVRVF